MEALLDKAKETITGFLDSCTSCSRCVEVCPFLKRYGNPLEIISKNSEVVFECTNCSACSIVCPAQINPSDALHSLKYKLIKTGEITEKTGQCIQSSLNFAERGHGFPFSYYPQTETVFWPGCSLAGTNPEVVKKIKNILSSKLNRKVGIVLDCCSDPLFQNGDIENTLRFIDDIKKNLRNNKIKELITGCTNCYKIFNLYMPEFSVKHVIEVLPENVFSIPESNIFLHHPCPSWRFEDLRKKAKEKIRTAQDEAVLPMCCGLGGGVSSLEPELSEEFTERVISKAKDSTILTYCMGCKNKFLKKGKEAYHILEFIMDAKPLKKPVSSSRKWLNRLILAMGQRLKNKKFVMGITVLIAIIIATYLRKSGYISPVSLLDFIKQYKILAPALFIIIYAIGPSIFIPSLQLTLGAGFLWGPFWGVIFSITGATIGASVSFLLARYIIGDTIRERFSYTRWEWLKEKVERHGWKAVAFTRIIPIFPYPILNYLFGITPIPFFHYLWSTFVFMLPACIAYVAFGSSMGELILKGNIKGIITGILIASVAMILPVVFKPMLKKVLLGKNE